MPKPRLWWLLVLVPVSLVSRYALHADLATFLTSAGAIIPLAGLIGRSTGQLAVHAGERIGGLLNASFANVTELIISIFLILRGETAVVKASLTGSIIGNLLLVLGLSFLAGGLKREEQSFSAEAAAVHSTSMILAVIGLLMPALFVLTSGRHGFVERETVSVAIALVLMAMYAAALVFMLVTHRHVFRVPSSGERAEWSVRRSVATLLGATAVVALESELLVGALQPTVAQFGLSKFFVGLILVPIVGNAAENSSAVLFAMRDRVDVTLEIAIGSSTQVALFVAPVLVLLSLALGHPLDFVFSPFEVAAVAGSAVIVVVVARDGRSNWLEGAQLLGAYAIMAVSFFFVRHM